MLYPTDLFGLYILFSQYRSCDNTQEVCMPACTLFNEQNKGPSLLSIITWSVLGKQNVQAEKVYSNLLGIKRFVPSIFISFKCECYIIMQIQHTKNLNPERFELRRILSGPNRSTFWHYLMVVSLTWFPVEYKCANNSWPMKSFTWNIPI